MNYRIYVEKREAFQLEAKSLLAELNENLQLHLAGLRYINVYDLFGFTPELLDRSRYSVFGEIVTDEVSDRLDLSGHKYLAVEFIPGQFDQRASSAIDCVHLIDPAADIDIRSSRLLLFPAETTDEDLPKIRHYYINAVEAREKDLSVLSNNLSAEVKPLAKLDGFTDMKPAEYAGFCKQWGLAMNADDLGCVVDYFRCEKRQPTETELRILDTYWSDHCRHTTFTTILENITIDDSFIKNDIESTLGMFHDIRRELGRENKPLCLMELATIGARYLRHKGLLGDMEVSEENNACSIYITVDVDGQNEKWLLQFKNETHNHPTEIEPFGGASTCLGGAIRDPLSGRAYVYQAMRVTGAGDTTAPVSATLQGKLPQRVISRKAAQGYSSYGNQIGLATTCVREIHHPGYTAKRLEVGAVVGAVPAANVRRESPAPGDVILLLGGRTGRDGIGGATGSSKEHTVASLESCGSEVQKGNAPEERKLQRLFRHEEVTRLIKKSNDFGAGGVSVAIGELADGLDIYLDRVPTKYSGLNPTELAISESQERMAVVVEAKDREEFEAYCRRDNVEVTYVADVTDSGRMRQYYKGTCVANLSREFIDSAGAKHYAKAEIGAVAPTMPKELPLLEQNIDSEAELISNFDASIGRSTVLMPFGGKYQSTPAQVSVQKLPTDGLTHTASIMAFGFNPYISDWSPYHGAAYAVVEACAKVVAAGGDYRNMRFSYQEYFERMSSARAFGKPLAALLGALKMQVELGLPAIGGKDSMSGTFEDLNVPPTLIAFGITTVDARRVISPEFKGHGRLRLYRHEPLENGMPNVEQLKSMWTEIHERIGRGEISAAWALGFGGVHEALDKMSRGNDVHYEVSDAWIRDTAFSYGSILVEEVYRPKVYIPVFPGTNCDYDSAKAWRVAGAEVETTIFRNLTGEDVLRSIDEMTDHIDACDILMFAGGFSAGDEPDGSAKFICSCLYNEKVAGAIERLQARRGLILGICNGFQALIKSGLLPYGKLGCVTSESPTLFHNDCNHHLSQMVTTRVATLRSPWLSDMTLGEEHHIAISHGEGRFTCSSAVAKELFDRGQVAFTYVDNPNGSTADIEGIISPDGLILGKMGHSERYEPDLMRNIPGNKTQNLFGNAVRYIQSLQSL